MAETEREAEDNAFWDDNARQTDERKEPVAKLPKGKKVAHVFADRLMNSRIRRLNRAGGGSMIAQLQAKHRCKRETVLLFQLPGLAYYLKIANGKIVRIPPQEGTPRVTIKSTKTLLSLQRGHIKIPQQDGTFEIQEYRCFHAWSRGDLEVWTPDQDMGWWSDMTFLDDLLRAGLFDGVFQ